MAHTGMSSNHLPEAELKKRAAGIRVFLSDIDGTAVRPDKSIADATRAAVAQLEQLGIAFTLVSARPPRGMLPVVSNFGLKHPYAGFNGGSLVDVNGKVLSCSMLPASIAAEGIQLGRDAGYEVYVFADDKWLLTEPDREYVPIEQHTLQFGPSLVADFESVMDRVEKIVIASGDEPGLAALEKKSAAQLQGRATASRSQTYYLDITALDANKGNAVLTLAKHFNVLPSQIAVAGDGTNDIPMFQQAGLSFAMGQGSAAVQAAATAVTLSNVEDGVAAAIRRYFFG